jgi:hypothetical protein
MQSPFGYAEGVHRPHQPSACLTVVTSRLHSSTLKDGQVSPTSLSPELIPVIDYFSHASEGVLDGQRDRSKRSDQGEKKNQGEQVNLVGEV